METIKTVRSKFIGFFRNIGLLIAFVITMTLSYFVCTKRRQVRAIEFLKILLHVTCILLLFVSFALLGTHHYFFGIIFFNIGILDLFQLFIEVDNYSASGTPLMTKEECAKIINYNLDLLEDWSEQFPKSLFGRKWIRYKNTHPEWDQIYM